MRNKDSIILKKILEYCDQVSEACEMFGNDYDKFINISVFQNACCMCILQVGESESSDRCVLCDRDNFDGWRHCFRVCCRYQ